MKSPVFLCVVIYTLFFSCDMVIDEPAGGERSWGETQLIGDINGYASNVTIEMSADGSGNLFIVGNDFAKRYVDGIGWYIDEESQINHEPNEFLNPLVVENNSGDIGVIWRRLIPALPDIQVLGNVYTDSGLWDSFSQDGLNTDNFDSVGLGTSSPPMNVFSADINSNGDVIAVWAESSDGPSYTYPIGYSFFSKSGGWIYGNIPGTGAVPTKWPKVVFITQNQAIAVWKYISATSVDIYNSTFTQAGGWTSVSQIGSIPHDDALRRMEIGKDASGNVVVIISLEHEIWSMQYNVGIGWSTTNQIYTTTDLIDEHYKFCMNSKGEGCLIWKQSRQQTVDVEDILVMPFRFSNGWGSSQAIDVTIYPVHIPEIEIDSLGNCMAVWHQIDTLNKSTLICRYLKKDSTWTSPKNVFDYQTNNIINYAIKSDANGNFCLIWASPGENSNNYFCWANRFE